MHAGGQRFRFLERHAHTVPREFRGMLFVVLPRLVFGDLHRRPESLRDVRADSKCLARQLLKPASSRPVDVISALRPGPARIFIDATSSATAAAGGSGGENRATSLSWS